MFKFMYGSVIKITFQVHEDNILIHLWYHLYVLQSIITNSTEVNTIKLLCSIYIKIQLFRN